MIKGQTMNKKDELCLTHEGNLTDSITHLLNGCALVKTLSRGKNLLINQVTEDLEVACNKALDDLKNTPYRVSRKEWNDYLKSMGLKVYD
ncbi:hypothetical protein [Lactococcus petauri]|uniref:Uncharacterized protein n=1 Tax=Lactococcus petauri TaxID=1940789 RepID=A0A252CF50_9LACT|nr:hypothetical protein [Lactococcus petauri]OUK05217.1 hypothetical protein BZZ03_00430 [Lactococcus petauri]